MHSKKQRPSWWLIYLSLPMMIGLFILETRLSLPDTERRLVILIILLIVSGGISIWLKANTRALMQEDLESWRAALRMDSSPISSQSEKVVRTDGNLNRPPQRVQGSNNRRPVGWASRVSGYFHL